jgi:hypothetical protein
VQQHRLRMFENNVMKKNMDLKVEKVVRDCRKLHNELHNLFSSKNIVRVIK